MLLAPSARIRSMPDLLFTPPCGPIRGWRDGDVTRATGIRYAEAARFAPPRAAPDHADVFDAGGWAPSCPQLPSAGLVEALGPGVVNGLPHDEHCQRLSITMPADRRDDEILPVMVWIHGGSYTSGSGDLPTTDPARLVAEQRVVVVTVTYRLGLFGFLGSDEARPANLGLLDQLEAFRWVQRNIRAFGGDPDRVTAFGQSAGADAVAHLMLAPGARELFQGAIIQSAPLGLSRGRRRMNEAMSAVAADLTVETPAAEVADLETATELAAAPFGVLRNMPFGTQYGHAPLPDEDEVAARWAEVAPHFDVLIGNTSQEARLFLDRIPAVARLDRVEIGPLAIGRMLTEVLVIAFNETIYARDARAFARRHVGAGGRAWRYVLSWRVPGNPYGSAHAIDLPLLFENPEVWAPAGVLAGADPTDLARAASSMRRIWGDFAHGRTWRAVRLRRVIRLRRV